MPIGNVMQLKRNSSSDAAHPKQAGVLADTKALSTCKSFHMKGGVRFD
jgi:hypothetical protein